MSVCLVAQFYKKLYAVFVAYQLSQLLKEARLFLHYLFATLE